MAGRKPLGPAIVAHLDGSRSAKERLELILETLAGQVTVVSACQILGISEAMFYKLRNRILQGCLEDLEPKPRGRPPRLVTGDEARSEELATQVAVLERAQPVRHDQRGTPAHEPLQRLHDERFRAHVHGARGLVQHDEGRGRIRCVTSSCSSYHWNSSMLSSTAGGGPSSTPGNRAFIRDSTSRSRSSSSDRKDGTCAVWRSFWRSRSSS